MEQNTYAKILDELYEWTMDTSKLLDPRGKMLNGEFNHTPPEGGTYPVVLASRPREKRCEGPIQCQYPKTYSRTTEGWREYCQECRRYQEIKSITIKSIHLDNTE
jgi:hypothetical protein